LVAIIRGLNEEIATRLRSPSLNPLLVESSDRLELLNRRVGDLFKSRESVRHEDCCPIWVDPEDSNEQALRCFVRSVRHVFVERCALVRPNVPVEGRARTDGGTDGR